MMIMGKATKIRQPSVQSNLVFQGLKNRLRKEKKKKAQDIMIVMKELPKENRALEIGIDIPLVLFD